MSKNIRNLSARKGMEDNLFEALDQAGAPTEEYLRQVADKYLIGTANTYGAASFYDFLNPEKSGKKAFVCAGSACLLAGTQDEVKNALCQHLNPEEVGEVYCLGRCYENKAFHAGQVNYSGQDLEHLADILTSDRKPAARAYHVGSHGPAILTRDALTDAQCLANLKSWMDKGPEALLDAIQQSGLRGRGGAGFPMAIKLNTVQKEVADQKYIVCNADEGDPGAFSDRYLLEEQPHLVMAGMALAGFITGATEGIVYIRAEYPESITICKDMARRFNEMFPLPLANGTSFSFQLRIVRAQGAYICGEETALLNSLEGNRPEVRTRPPFPAQYGLFGKPTVVNNVETLANLPFICEKGGDAFAAIGTEKSKGTKLLSLDSHFNNPGLYEVPMGTPLGFVVDNLGGGFKEPVKALHIGGPLGGIVPASRFPALSIDFESFAQGGFLLGHASILSIPERFPMVAYLEHLFAFTAHESCGKCFPCRLGSVRGKEMLQKAQNGTYRIDRELMADLLDTLEQGSLCALGGGIPLPVRNALQYFEDELKPYFS